jgi:hypothetical protein
MATKSYEWTLTARQQQGALWLEWSTDAPFRAQQGQIVVYQGTTWPQNAQDDVKASTWDDSNNSPWKTGLPWGSDWYCAYIAQSPPNGPYVYNVRLFTTGGSDPESEVSE